MAEERRGQRPERGNGQGRGGSDRPNNSGGRAGGPARGGQGGAGGSAGGRSGGPSRGGQGGQGGSRPSYSRDGDDRRSSGPRREGDQGGYRSGGGSAGGAARGGQGGSRPSYSRDGDDRRSGGSAGGRSGGPSRGGQGGPGARSGGPRRDGDKGGFRSSGPRRDGGRDGGRDNSRDWKRDVQVDRTVEQARYDGPELPAEITGKELDRNIAAQLKGLPEKLATRVARHMVAAGRLIDTDPETAYQHTLAARARAARLAVVREATGEAAYAAGHYAEALSELRAAKRMNGAPDYLPIMADCHRALKQPEQAIKLAKSPSVKNFSPEAKAEMTIVEAAARSDMGQVDAALRTLELAPLMHKSRASWVARLRYAYADTLLMAGREEEALAWFHRTHAVDSDDVTDAANRAEELERKRRS